MIEKISYILQQIWADKPLMLGILVFAGIAIWFFWAFFRDRRAEFDPEHVMKFVRANYSPSAFANRQGDWTVVRSPHPMEVRFKISRLPSEAVPMFMMEIKATAMKAASLTFNTDRQLRIFSTDGDDISVSELNPVLTSKLRSLVDMLMRVNNCAALPPEA